MSSVGVVLSGGGARGAYEAGVLAGIFEVLGLDARSAGPAPFDVFCGTSVGAINAAWLAAHCDRANAEIDGLLRNWLDLDVDKHLRVNPGGIVDLIKGLSILLGRPSSSDAIPRSLLRIDALEALVRDAMPWERLQGNVRSGNVRALIVAALHIATGRTVLFADLAPGVSYAGSRDMRRVHKNARISADHVLASAAIPLIFPSRKIDGTHYCDGGLRFNTPIAPAIRAGADKLVVIPLLRERGEPSLAQQAVADYPNPIFLIGKLLNALLLDPVLYDLQILERFNALFGALEGALTPEELSQVHDLLHQTRGMPYRRIETLVFRPTQDIGAMARDRAEELGNAKLTARVISRASKLGHVWEADLLSFVLFDGVFAERLIELGRSDVVRRAGEVRRFFGRS
ncbi:MAG: patatin-like phospholipase family protein [Sandaracinaceae bacterium]|nr:patatin-like phospholipase family protein [Sandaracinaceae bacterium]